MGHKSRMQIKEREHTRQNARNTRGEWLNRGDHLQPTYPQIGRSVFLNPRRGNDIANGPWNGARRKMAGVPRGVEGGGVWQRWPMRVSKRAFKKALLEANDRETRLLVRKPHIIGDRSGLVGLFFGAGGQHFWNWEGEPHDNARASLAYAQNEMTTTHLMTHFLYYLPFLLHYDIKKAS